MTSLRRIPLFVLMAALLLLAYQPAGASAPAASHVVRVPASAAARVAQLGLAPTVALDYGAFLWLHLSDTDWARLQASGLPAQEETDPFLLRLGEQSFDPLLTAPALAPGWEPARGSGPDLHLVQFVGPTRGEWLAGLEASGLRVVQYLHPHTYVVWGDAAALGAASRGAGVRWTGAFAPAFRALPRWQALDAQNYSNPN